MRRVDQMLHLHGFQHRNLLAGSHQVAFGDIDGDDGSLQRRRHRHRACGTRRGRRGLDRRTCPVRLFDQQRLDIFGRADEIGDMRIDEAGRDAVGREVRMRQDRGKERDIGGDTADAELAQRAAGLLHRVLPLCACRMHDHLGEQGIERGAGPVAGIAKGIDAHAGAGRQIEHAKRPAGRLGRAGLVHGFHVDAKLHGIAARFRHIGLRQPERAERGAVGDRKLRPHEVDAEHLFRHGMLDLQPRIGLDEGKRRVVAVRVVIDQELEGAEIVVMRGGGELLGGFDDARAQGLAERRAGRDLDELLVAPLDGAFALPEMADRAMAVADDLHLDVAGLADQPLDIDVTVAECGHRLGLATRVSLVEPRGVIDDTHAAAAAAGNRLDHDSAMRREERARLLQRGRPLRAIDNRHAAIPGQRLCLGLVAEQLQRRRLRAHEGDPLLDRATRQGDILAEEAIARMQGIATGGLGGGNDRFDIEIGTRAAARDLVALVGGADVQRGGVVGRMDRNDGEPRVGGGARDANGDLAAVGDQELPERHGQSRNSAIPHGRIEHDPQGFP